MKILYEGNIIEVFPKRTSIIGGNQDGETIVEVGVPDSNDSFFLSMPFRSCDIGIVERGEYFLDAYISNSFQDGVHTRIKYKDGANDKKVVGYFFPLSTLGRKLTTLKVGEVIEYSDAYALAAVLELLKFDVGQAGLVSVIWGETYSIPTFFRSDLVLAIYEATRFSVDINSACAITKRFFPIFADVGIFDIAAFSEHMNIRKSDDCFFIVEDISAVQYSEKIGENSINFLRNTVLGVDVSSSDPVIRFFMQYQFFELLMQEVYSGIMNQFLDEANDETYRQNSWKAKGLVERLHQKNSDRNKLNHVFCCLGSDFSDEIGELLDKCISFLSEIGAPALIKTADSTLAYYTVRNIIFHGYGSYRIDSAAITEVCDSVSRLIYKIPISFGRFPAFFGANEENTDP